MSLVSQVLKLISNSVQDAFNVELDPRSLSVELPPDAAMGHLAFACFPLAKACRRAPQQIAQELAARLEGKAPLTEVNAAGPYLNLKVDVTRWFSDVILAQREGLPQLPDAERERVVVEYSCPNTNKPQHLGHVRNNILGEGLANLLSVAGHDVTRVNLINDRGVHICRSMLAWQRWGEGVTPESSGEKGDHLVGRFYVLFAQKLKAEQDAWYTAKGVDPKVLPRDEQDALEQEFGEKSELLSAVRQMLRDWEAGDTAVRQLWERMNSWVFDGFEQTYSELGVHFDRVYYESNTYLLGRDIIEAGLDKGSLERNDTGAVVCSLEELKLQPKVLLRSDGTSLYMTQDIGTAVARQRELDFQRMIYVVGNEQEHHFRVLFHVLQKLGYDWADRLLHFSYGMVNLTTGKMKSREGRVVDADDLLQELKDACREVMQQGERRLDMPVEEQEEVVHALALGALKYFVLKVNPKLDMLYDPKESIDLQGNTGPYLQYAQARIRSLIRKSGVDAAAVTQFDKLGNEEEVELLKQLAFWPLEVQQAAAQFNPSRVATRTYELARAFSRFFNAHSVFDRVDDPELAQQRIALVDAVGTAIRQGLDIMGIPTPERI